MIKTFRNKELAKFWEGVKSKIDARFHDRILQRLQVLDVATAPEQLNLPGFDYHPLKGKPQRYSLHVNGPWCVTFEFENEDAYRVDFEQYH
jgi:proteic killer suppression protein